MDTVGIGGMNYILFAIDADTTYLFAIPLKAKKETAEKLAALLTRTSVHACRNGDSVKYLHTHQGGEFKNHYMEEYCDRHGITHNFSATQEHRSNGLIER